MALMEMTMAHKLPLADIKFIQELHAYCLTRVGGYHYGDCNDCALAQFLRDSGRATNPLVGGRTWTERLSGGVFGETHMIPEMVQDTLFQGNRTFSALAARLEAILTDAPKVSA